MPTLNVSYYLKLNDDQFSQLKIIATNILRNHYYEKVVISASRNFILFEHEGDEGVIVNWLELCLFIIPKALGIKNLILNIESPMHPADFIIQEYEKSRNPEKLNG